MNAKTKSPGSTEGHWHNFWCCFTRPGTGILFLVVFLAFASTNSAIAASFTQIDESYFGTPAVVGVDSITPASPAVIGFDYFPDGTPIDTLILISGTLHRSFPLTTAFETVGVLLGADDVAVSQSGGPDGIGMRSPPNTLASELGWPFSATTDIMFSRPTSAAGFLDS